MMAIQQQLLLDSPPTSPRFEPTSPTYDPAAGSPPPADRMTDLHVAWDMALATKQEPTTPVAVAKLKAAKSEKKVSLKGVEYTRWCDPVKRNSMVEKSQATRRVNAAKRAAEVRAEKLAVKRDLVEKQAFENAISYMVHRVGRVADEQQARGLEQEALGVVRAFMVASEYPDYVRATFQIWDNSTPPPPAASAEPESVDDAVSDPDAGSDAVMAQIATTDAVKEAVAAHITTLGLSATA